jgi:hypothetical protein
MATHDYVIDNQTAPNFRADLNNALAAIVTQNSNATAPSVTYANMFWYDTANNLLRKRNEANSGWITLGTIDEGTGTFTPSGERALASQVQAEAGTDNTTVMTPLRVSQAITALSGTATAALSVGAVGTYAFLSENTNATVNAGNTRAGSNLYYAGVGIGTTPSTSGEALGAGWGSQPSGTWRAMGYAAINGGAGRYNTTVWLRIS